MNSENFDATKDDLRDFLRADIDGSRVHRTIADLVVRHKELSAQQASAKELVDAKHLGASSEAMMIAANIVEKLSSQRGR
jgi:hypothetical protein